MFWSRKPLTLPTPEEALPGRPTPITLPARHAVHGAPLDGPYAEGLEVLDLGMGCFWGAERIFWQIPGVVTTLVGYEGGLTPNPTYEETCTGLTGHAEVVRVVYDPSVVALETPSQMCSARWETLYVAPRGVCVTFPAPTTICRVTRKGIRMSASLLNSPARPTR